VGTSEAVIVEEIRLFSFKILDGLIRASFVFLCIRRGEVLVVQAGDLIEEEVAETEDVDGSKEERDEEIAAVEQRHQQSRNILGEQLKDVRYRKGEEDR